MAVAAAQKNREMFAIKKSYSIEVSLLHHYLRNNHNNHECQTTRFGYNLVHVQLHSLGSAGSINNYTIFNIDFIIELVFHIIIINAIRTRLNL